MKTTVLEYISINLMVEELVCVQKLLFKCQNKQQIPTINK